MVNCKLCPSNVKSQVASSRLVLLNSAQPARPPSLTGNVQQKEPFGFPWVCKDHSFSLCSASYLQGNSWPSISPRSSLPLQSVPSPSPPSGGGISPFFSPFHHILASLKYQSAVSRGIRKKIIIINAQAEHAGPLRSPRSRRNNVQV